jgi:hypothetical protein
VPGVGQWREVLDIRGHNHQFFLLYVGEYIVLIVSVLIEYVVRVLGRLAFFPEKFSNARFEVCVDEKPPPHLSFVRGGDAIGSGDTALYVGHDLLPLASQVLELSGVVVIV